MQSETDNQIPLNSSIHPKVYKSPLCEAGRQSGAESTMEFIAVSDSRLDQLINKQNVLMIATFRKHSER